VRHHPDPPAGRRHQVVADPYPRQVDLFHTNPTHPLTVLATTGPVAGPGARYGSPAVAEMG
jgi:hypothetical protein